MPQSGSSRPTEPCKVVLAPPAAKDLKDLRQFRERVVRELSRLEMDPLAGHPLTGPLGKLRSLEFSLPGGEFRAVYFFHAASRTCFVIAVGPHEHIYEQASRRYEYLRNFLRC